jgi:hypothetical protein
MTHRLIVSLLVIGCLSGCYTIRTSAPPGSVTAFASSDELCLPVDSRRVHYALVGLVPINNNHVAVPANMRVRVVTEATPLDVVLRALGTVFTFGLYGGSQSARVEVCPAVAVAGVAR